MLYDASFCSPPPSPPPPPPPPHLPFILSPHLPLAALRTLRTLRSVSFIRGLQVLVSALIQTFTSSVFYLLLLLLILMFLFAIMGHYFFGYEEGGDKRNWGTFGQSMMSLFTFVTVRGGGGRCAMYCMAW